MSYLRLGIAARWLLVLAVLVSRSAFAQVDLSGEWAVRAHEDQWHRQAGPKVGEFLGFPMNDAARLKAESWTETVLALPERQCIPHVATYSMRNGGGTTGIRISKELDPVTRELVAYHVAGMFGRADRTIWLDGRPHPPPYAPHTWAGFSTGIFEDGMLTVKTTHIKMGWLERNGIPTSDQATMTEHFLRHDNYLTLVGIVEDPVYLTEPFIRTSDWVLNLTQQVRGLYPCGPDQITDEAAGLPEGVVPHHLPGASTSLKVFASAFGLPEEAVVPGPQTMYPEYMITLRKMMAESAAARSTAAARRAAARAAAIARGADPVVGSWLLNRGKSTFTRIVPPPERRTMRFEEGPDGTITHITDTVPMANDTGFIRVEYTAKYDGKDYPIEGSNLDAVALTRLDANTVVRTGKLKGQVIETATRVLSADGNTLTITTKGTFAGRDYSNVQVFDRQN